MISKLPLIRLSAVNPFLVELRRRGFDPRSLLKDFGLPTNIPASDDLFIASAVIYELVERTAELAGDRFFGFAVGRGLNLMNWNPISSAAGKAATVGELLTLFVIDATEYSTASKFYLTAAGQRSTFGLERVKKPSILPGQNDAFYSGFMSQLLRRATRNHWDVSRILFTVADPECIPTEGGVRKITKGGRSGVKLTFPTQWLFEQFDKPDFIASTGFGRDAQSEMAYSLLDSIRIALLPYLQDSALTVDKAAKICGYDRRRLSQVLREKGTTLSKEIAKLRAEKASQRLAGTRQSVADIGQAVGYNDPSVFSRAFKAWTGQSPQVYRRTHRLPGQSE